MRCPLLMFALLAGSAESPAAADSVAEFSLVGPAETAVAWGSTVEFSVRVSHNERLAACAYRFGITGTASGLLTDRVVHSPLAYLGTNGAAPLASGLPAALPPGAELQEVFLNLDSADPPGNPLDGLAPGANVTLATYALRVFGAGSLTLTLQAPQAAETQSAADGALFAGVSVAPLAMDMTLTVFGGPDLNVDDHVDLRDFLELQKCLGQAPNGACASADVDADGDIDLTDFVVVQGCLGGPVAGPACAGVRGSSE